MNKKYFLTTLCVTVLAFAPACCRKERVAAEQKAIDTMHKIEDKIVLEEAKQEVKEVLNGKF